MVGTNFLIVSMADSSEIIFERIVNAPNKIEFPNTMFPNFSTANFWTGMPITFLSLLIALNFLIVEGSQSKYTVLASFLTSFWLILEADSSESIIKKSYGFNALG